MGGTQRRGKNKETQVLARGLLGHQKNKTGRGGRLRHALKGELEGLLFMGRTKGEGGKNRGELEKIVDSTIG